MERNKGKFVNERFLKVLKQKSERLGNGERKLEINWEKQCGNY